MSWHLGKGRYVRLFGLDIFDTTLASAANWLVKRAAAGMPTVAGFLNAHYVNVAHHNPAYRETITGFDRMFADGAGVRLAAKAAGLSLTENVNGTDLFPVLCLAASRYRTPLFLLGSRPGVAEAAATKARSDHPRLEIAGTWHGYLDDPREAAAAIASMNASGAKVLIVGMGVPDQELWIARNRHRIDIPVIIAVGGLLDFVSGRVPRAPLALRQWGLEWAWRLAMEPLRMWKRYVIGNASFIARLAWQIAFVPHRFDQTLARENILAPTAPVTEPAAIPAEAGIRRAA